MNLNINKILQHVVVIPSLSNAHQQVKLGHLDNPTFEFLSKTSFMLLHTYFSYYILMHFLGNKNWNFRG